MSREVRETVKNRRDTVEMDGGGGYGSAQIEDRVMDWEGTNGTVGLGICSQMDIAWFDITDSRLEYAQNIENVKIRPFYFCTTAEGKMKILHENEKWKSQKQRLMELGKGKQKSIWTLRKNFGKD